MPNSPDLSPKPPATPPLRARRFPPPLKGPLAASLFEPAGTSGGGAANLLPPASRSFTGAPPPPPLMASSAPIGFDTSPGGSGGGSSDAAAFLAAASPALGPQPPQRLGSSSSATDAGDCVTPPPQPPPQQQQLLRAPPQPAAYHRRVGSLEDAAVDVGGYYCHGPASSAAASSALKQQQQQQQQQLQQLQLPPAPLSPPSLPSFALTPPPQLKQESAVESSTATAPPPPVAVAAAPLLIPNELPSSRVLYVLTTAEGRDKLFKALQYALQIVICLLQLPNLLPAGSEQLASSLAQRFVGNISTIRNGRALFKVGRWLITVFHLQGVVLRLVDRRRANARSRQQQLQQQPQQQPPAATPWLSRLASLLRLWRRTAGPARSGSNGPCDVAVPAALAWPVRWRKPVDAFRSDLMLLLGVRCAASIARNILRDALFLATKRLFPGEALTRAVDARRRPLLAWANRTWLLVSLIDLALNTTRLADRGWLAFAKARRSFTGRCACRNGGNGGGNSREGLLAFPPTDFDFGSVATATAKFFEAADPASMEPYCERCGCLFREPANANANANAAAATNALATAGGRPPQTAPLRHDAMLVPWVVRRCFDVAWVVRRHGNLRHTLLLQVRYACDVFVAVGHVLGDYDAGAGGGNDDDDGDEAAAALALAQHRHLGGAVAGALSACVALYRVFASSPQ